MNKISLSIKISTLFLIVSIITVLFLYVTFSSLLERYMLASEKEKVSLIAETIEPMVAMNFYLELPDEVTSLVNQVAKRKNVLGIEVRINDSDVWKHSYTGSLDSFNVNYRINDPVTSSYIGEIIIIYSKASFNLAVEEVRRGIVYYLAILSMVFLTIALIIRYLLSPLSHIADSVKSYQPGKELDFSGLRLEPETRAISDAFSLMLENVREYTVLLEQYKHSVDESSIVSKMSHLGFINYVNDEFVRVCGHSREQLIGMQYDYLSVSFTDNAVLSEIKDFMIIKKIWKGVLKNKTKNGEVYHVKSTIVPLLDDKGHILEFICIQHDITQVVVQGERILKQSTDENTGLPNRVKLSEDVASKDKIIFALFSLDNYEIIKNYYGYDAAYAAVKKLADMLESILSSQNIQIYKLAGGEFGFLNSENIDLDWFRQICLFAIKKSTDFHIDIDGYAIDMRASAGFTTNKKNYLSYSGLALRHALDQHKSLIYYEDQENLIAQYENNLLWTKKIKSALADDRITLVVQPIFDSLTLKITKYECLVRLIDDDGKLISPFFFLDVAKKTKLYHTITHKVIDIAFSVFSQIPDMDFSINLSAEDILHHETVEYLENKIKKYNIGDRVVLEIVESEGIESFSEITDFISKMKALGCTIAIDDFGTGYSNFSYLLQLNIDILKVDGSLIKDIDHNKNSQIICETILSFCSALNLSTVAEYVHNESVLNYLKDIGFDYLQGFHLGEPVSIYSLLNK